MLMDFNIEEYIEKYINELPDNVEYIILTYKGLNYIPDLSRFYNLTELRCGHNFLTSLPLLPPSLERLYCDHNRLTLLPQFNARLQELDCSTNRLTCLPPFNEDLELLFCYNNYIDRLPYFNNTLRGFYDYNNPINQIIEASSNLHDLNEKKRIVKILHKFRYLYYSLKFKKQFRDWLWIRIREPKIKEKYSCENLLKLLENKDLEQVLETW